MEPTNLLEDKITTETEVKQGKSVDFDLDLSATRKKRIRIDGDDNRIIELNTSDLDIAKRLDTLADKINNLSQKVVDLKYDEEFEEIEQTAEIVEAISTMDKEMRELIDYLFQSPVANACAPDGTMWDMFNGRYRYEIIIEQLLNLYADNINEETQKVMNRMKKHTDKYTKRFKPKDHLRKE